MRGQPGNYPDARPDPSAAGGILVVDDDAAIRSVLQLLLQRHGFRVWLAAGGREAVELYRDHHDAISVVLLDVRMPGLDGPQTLGALRRADPAVRACFMSADPGDYRPDELLRQGARRVFPKPLPLPELLDALGELASRDRSP